MREAFNLVRGAVAKKDLTPVLTHFAVHQGRLHGFNGRVHLSVPCPELAALPSFTVPAATMLAAMDACAGEPALEVKGSTLQVFEGTFTAVLPTGPIDAFPLPAVPEYPGASLIGVDLLTALYTLSPFIGEDASRPWCLSVKFEQRQAVATNNVILAILPLPDFLFPATVLPVFAIEELLRLGLHPLSVAADGDNAVIFYLPGDIWLRTVLVQDGWPQVNRVWEAAQEGAQWVPVTAKLAAAVQQVTPFCPDPGLPAIVLEGEQVRTKEGTTCAMVHGFSDLQGTYRAEPLSLVLKTAEEVAWNKFPRVPWRGNGMHGVLVGLAG